MATSGRAASSDATRAQCQSYTTLLAVRCHPGEPLRTHGARLTKKRQIDRHTEERKRSYTNPAAATPSCVSKVFDRVRNYEENYKDNKRREAGFSS